MLAYIAAVYKPLETISYTLGSLQDKLVGLRMAFHILDTEPAIQDAPDATPSASQPGDSHASSTCPSAIQAAWTR